MSQLIEALKVEWRERLSHGKKTLERERGRFGKAREGGTEREVGRGRIGRGRKELERKR